MMYSCRPTIIYSDNYPPIDAKGISKISIEVFKDSLSSIFEIKNFDSIRTFVDTINNSKIDGPWKSVNWDKINLEFQIKRFIGI